jgi:N6-adenosine-specific RNA methylase IME4
MGTLSRLPRSEPIVIGCYTLHATGLEVVGHPSLAEHQGVGDFIFRAQKAAGWWVADWLRYGATREDWKERLSQVVDAGLCSEKTAQNLKYLGENVASSRRREDVDISLHFEVADLPAKDQSAWLEEAAAKGYSTRDLRNEIRASKRRRVLESQATLEGMYRVIYADPPWSYGDSGVITQGDAYGRAERHYPSMSMGELCELPVAAHAHADSVLFCWVTAPMLLENPGPREVIEAWGFKPKTGLVWDKVLHNFGHYVSVRHEHLIIATRGSCLPDRPTPMPDSVQTIRRGDVHSEKPQEFRQLIEQLYDGPRVELFAREKHPGWQSFGNDARLWAQEASA